jgi:flagellar basal-body rod protein FlgB
MAIDDLAVIESLRRQMALAAAKQAVAAGNLANVDTPGYRARDVRFDDALSRELSLPVATTSPRHLATEPQNGVETAEAEGLQPRRDGNTVQIDRELLSMTEAAGQFARAQTVLAAKFRLVRYAISEGR